MAFFQFQVLQRNTVNIGTLDRNNAQGECDLFFVYVYNRWCCSFASQHMYIHNIESNRNLLHPLSQLERAATKLKVNNLLQCRFFTIVQNVFNVAPIKNEKITMNKFFTVKILAVSISIGMVWLQFRWFCFRSTEYFQQVSRFCLLCSVRTCSRMKEVHKYSSRETLETYVTYNGEKLLAVVQSIWLQMFASWECIMMILPALIISSIFKEWNRFTENR